MTKAENLVYVSLALADLRTALGLRCYTGYLYYKRTDCVYAASRNLDGLRLLADRLAVFQPPIVTSILEVEKMEPCEELPSPQTTPWVLVACVEAESRWFCSPD